MKLTDKITASKSHNPKLDANNLAPIAKLEFVTQEAPTYILVYRPPTTSQTTVSTLGRILQLDRAAKQIGINIPITSEETNALIAYAKLLYSTTEEIEPIWLELQQHLGFDWLAEVINLDEERDTHSTQARHVFSQLQKQLSQEIKELAVKAARAIVQLRIAAPKARA